jgi:cytoskeletal protein CcmA (bactofilin family)
MAIFDKGNTMAKETNSTTIISKGAKIKGELNLFAKLHIEGEVDGNIISTNMVSIGKDGKILGELQAKKLIVSGVFEGKATCDIVEIVSGGILRGEICMSDLIIEKGGIFEGTSSLKKKDNASKKL